MKGIKKGLAAVLALTVVLSFTACSRLRISTEAASVNGRVITKAELRYYLENIKYEMEQEAGEAGQAEDYWETAEVDGQKAADVARERALDEAIRVEIGAIKAEEAGLTIDAETQKQINALVNPQSSSEREQVEYIYDLTGLNDQVLKSMQEKQVLASLYQEKVLAEDTSLAPTEEEIVAKINEDNVLVKHVLLSTQDKEVPVESEAPAEGEATASPDAAASADPAASADAAATASAAPQTTTVPLTDEEKAAKKQTAEDVLARAKAGEDFDKLVADFGEDPGMDSSPQGYVVYKGSGMVEPFETAALALQNVGDVSDIVESDFGYHILKRYELTSDNPDYEQLRTTAEQTLQMDKYNAYIDGFRSEMDIQVEQGRVDSLPVKKTEVTQSTTGTSGGTSGVPVQ